MALGGSKKKKSSGSKGKSKKKEALWVTIMQVNENDDERLYLKANNHKGRLLWQAFGGEDGDDEENSTFFEVQTASLFDPHEKAPDFVKNNIVINLLNEKSAKEIDG